MAFILKLYLVWGLSMFALGLILLYPFFAIIIWSSNNKLLKATYYVNRLWAVFTYVMILVPVKRIRKTKLNNSEPYIFVSNHSSFLDIPAVQLIVNQFVVFLGKRSLATAPLFGWMFRNLHICVDRGNPEKTEEMFRKCLTKLEQGFSIGVFPEGTQNRTPPTLNKFKDGAFILAIRAQRPVVPVTIVSNWKIWPALAPRLSWSPLILVQHEPIPTKGMTLKDVAELRVKVKEVIETELKTRYPKEYNL
ncbi:1-acyl-sn-glycerol-3-phosphate acyltransferase [Flammeovirga sp. EKP202]|uniref:lysophospholipid acyltransferase family protein n=1 Tax=Flammeovirga sp. EKP202 TaxID=2770592 RepID=UPI00165F473F|nr:lysophospholipid acyltransferase family protein [Flammeovirga sp. EKP202]MBD0399889.1 1-acyl-sn-glycerol-3-phosphate acyltransferase [Flammeovirga sp. EKP202]